jgi:hypothetical protein
MLIRGSETDSAAIRNAPASSSRRGEEGFHEAGSTRRSPAFANRPVWARHTGPDRRGCTTSGTRSCFAHCNWYRAGIDVQAQLPLLSTYLGHVDPKSTYWYFQAAPELLALAAERLEYAWGSQP